MESLTPEHASQGRLSDHTNTDAPATEEEGYQLPPQEEVVNNDDIERQNSVPDDPDINRDNDIDESNIPQGPPNLPILSTLDSGRGTGGSQPLESVYIQQSMGFKTTGREQLNKILAKAKAKSDPTAVKDDETGEGRRLEAAFGPGLVIHDTFRTLGFLIQGLISGFSIFHAMSIWLSTPPHFSYAEFLENYAKRAMIFHVSYYIAFLIACIAAFDRFDIGAHSRRMLWRALTLQSGGLSVFAWLLALIFALIDLPTDHRMDLFRTNTTEFVIKNAHSHLGSPVYQPWTRGTLQWWRLSSICRATFATIGWTLSAVCPMTDNLKAHLLQTDISTTPQVGPPFVTQTTARVEEGNGQQENSQEE